jgi:multidrug resistance efflux pump
VITGHVESFAGGIEDRERTAGASLLANVNPTFAWVRLAQRIPVRINLEEVPDQTRLVSGRTATVAIDADGKSPRFDLIGALRKATFFTPRLVE